MSEEIKKVDNPKESAEQGGAQTAGGDPKSNPEEAKTTEQLEKKESSTEPAKEDTEKKPEEKAEEEKPTEEPESEKNSTQGENELKAKLAATELRLAVTLCAVEMGIPAKSLKYIARLIEIDAIPLRDGEPDPEAIKSAISAVIDDLPALANGTDENAAKKKTTPRIGADVGSSDEKSAASKPEKKAAVSKPWNKFNR